MERIICAAIHYRLGDKLVHTCSNIKSGLIVFGLRHGNCFSILNKIYPDREYITNNKDGKVTVQGFLTSENRFVTRREAAKIAFAAGQIPENIAKIEFLFSEDLY